MVLVPYDEYQRVMEAKTVKMKDQKPMIKIVTPFAQAAEMAISETKRQRVALKPKKTWNNNKTFRSFKSKENIHKKEVGPYHGFGYLSLISDPIKLGKGARGKYCEFAIFNNGSRLKD